MYTLREPGHSDTLVSGAGADGRYSQTGAAVCLNLVYNYIYIEREREREKDRMSLRHRRRCKCSKLERAILLFQGVFILCFRQAYQVGFSGKDLVMISSHFQVPPSEIEPAATEEDNHNISESRKLLHEIFQEQDRNGDGYLDVEELRCALRKLGHYITGKD